MTPDTDTDTGTTTPTGRPAAYSSGSVVNSNGYPLRLPASVALVARVSATSYV